MSLGPAMPQAVPHQVRSRAGDPASARASLIALVEHIRELVLS
ncbi:hypothetical protein ACIBQ1_24065 [Nonomuraea sp. NPDC050153]